MIKVYTIFIKKKIFNKINFYVFFYIKNILIIYLNKFLIKIHLYFMVRFP